MNLLKDMGTINFGNISFADIKEYFPIIIPLVLIEVALLLAAWIHIFRHKNYKRGNRVIWLLVSLITILGPVLYFVLGKEEE